MQPAFTHNEAWSPRFPTKNKTRAPSRAAVSAAVKPADPPPMMAMVLSAFISLGLDAVERLRQPMHPKEAVGLIQLRGTANRFSGFNRQVVGFPSFKAAFHFHNGIAMRCEFHSRRGRQMTLLGVTVEDIQFVFAQALEQIGRAHV